MHRMAVADVAYTCACSAVAERDNLNTAGSLTMPCMHLAPLVYCYRQAGLHIVQVFGNSAHPVMLNCHSLLLLF